MNDLLMLAQTDPAGSSSDSGAGPADGGSTESGTSQPGENPPANPGDQTKKPGGQLLEMAVPIALMMLVMYFMVFRGPQKKQKKHRQMLDNLKKNDKIRTIGGIIGTVVDVRDDEVVVKIDESNNTKMRFIRQAVNTVIIDEDKAEKK